MAFFDGFRLERIAVRDGVLRVRIGGAGPPLVLLHGNPQTHAMWHLVAPVLARDFTVIAPDLRGYGQSFKPAPTSDHAPYAKREMARDVVELTAGLGYERFSVAGHDRGGRVAHRLAIDHPERLVRLALLDIVPTIEHFERADMRFGMGYYHWFWFAQPHPFPEDVICAAPDAWFRAHTSREPKPPDFFAAEALADYLTAARTREMITGMCEDYRAAATVDLEHDRESRTAGRRIQCPLHVLWGSKGKIGVWYDPMAIWRGYADGPVSGTTIDTGHYLAEESPAAVITELQRFFSED
ncbi:MAG: alpha/beta hydrolase [Hyphomicrobiaceae bacterium]